MCHLGRRQTSTDTHKHTEDEDLEESCWHGLVVVRPAGVHLRHVAGSGAPSTSATGCLREHTVVQFCPFCRVVSYLHCGGGPAQDRHDGDVRGQDRFEEFGVGVDERWGVMWSRGVFVLNDGSRVCWWNLCAMSGSDRSLFIVYSLRIKAKDFFKSWLVCNG